MVELSELVGLLNADAVMSHEVAAELSVITSYLRAKYADYFLALNIGGSAANGGAVAKALLQNIHPRSAISDIDYGVILSRPVSLVDRKFLHQDIKRRLERIELTPCTAFNAEKVYLVVDEPENMVKWMRDIKSTKPTEAAQYLATRLLMPYGVIFPFSERKQLQEVVQNGLSELSLVDPGFDQEIRDAMNDTLQQRRRMKDKHIPDQEVREYLDINRVASNIHF